VIIPNQYSIPDSGAPPTAKIHYANYKLRIANFFNVEIMDLLEDASLSLVPLPVNNNAVLGKPAPRIQEWGPQQYFPVNNNFLQSPNLQNYLAIKYGRLGAHNFVHPQPHGGNIRMGFHHPNGYALMVF
jgi:hypothetical protein